MGQIPWRTLWPSVARARSNFRLPQTSSPLCAFTFSSRFHTATSHFSFPSSRRLVCLVLLDLVLPPLHHLVCSSYRSSSFSSSLALARDRYSLPADIRLLYVVEWSPHSAGLAARCRRHAPTHSATWRPASPVLLQLSFSAGPPSAQPRSTSRRPPFLKSCTDLTPPPGRLPVTPVFHQSSAFRDAPRENLYSFFRRSDRAVRSAVIPWTRVPGH